MRTRRLALGLALAAACAAAPPTVSVQVFGLFRPQRLTVSPVAGTVLEVEVAGQRFALEGAQAAGMRWAEGSMDCFLHRRLIPAGSLRASARGGSAAAFQLAVPGKIERRFHGSLVVRPREGYLEAVVRMDLEAAVAGVVAAESPPGAPLEALKAQAVVARSYYTATRGRHDGFDFCDTTHCQFLREIPARDSAFQRAVVESRGLVLLAGGRPLTALYTASCGGRTRTLEEIGLNPEGYPYFAVDCPPCRRAAKRWQSRLPAAEAAALLAAPGSEPARLAVVRKLGWQSVPGNAYEIRHQGDSVVLDGRGAGHGAGLCQQGAAALAAADEGFGAILERYFPAASLAAFTGSFPEEQPGPR